MKIYWLIWFMYFLKHKLIVDCKRLSEFGYLIDWIELYQGTGIKGKEMALVRQEKASRTALQTSTVNWHTLFWYRHTHMTFPPPELYCVFVCVCVCVKKTSSYFHKKSVDLLFFFRIYLFTHKAITLSVSS